MPSAFHALIIVLSYDVVGYMFQTTDKGWRPFGCASMYDSQANAAVVFLYGLVKDQFDLLCNELRESRNIIGLPTFIPICLLELKAEEVDKRLQFCHTELHQVKVQIGITRSNPMVDMSDFDKFDFVTISRMLTTLWATLAKCERTCEEHMMLLNDMGKYNDQFVLCLPESQQANAKKRMKVLQKRIDFVRDWTQTFGPGTKYLSQRSQAYVQTVSIHSSLKTTLTQISGVQSHGAKRQCPKQPTRKRVPACI
jgi:hypothetical protein